MGPRRRAFRFLGEKDLIPASLVPHRPPPPCGGRPPGLAGTSNSTASLPLPLDAHDRVGGGAAAEGAVASVRTMQGISHAETHVIHGRGAVEVRYHPHNAVPLLGAGESEEDRKSTRLNSSHSQISYAVFCLKKKKLL